MPITMETNYRLGSQCHSREPIANPRHFQRSLGSTPSLQAPHCVGARVRSFSPRTTDESMNRERAAPRFRPVVELVESWGELAAPPSGQIGRGAEWTAVCARSPFFISISSKGEEPGTRVCGFKGSLKDFGTWIRTAMGLGARVVWELTV